MKIMGTITLAGVVMLLAVTSAMAEPAVAVAQAPEKKVEHADRAKHFEADVPDTVQKSMAILRDRMKKVEAAHAKKDLYQIHELSYDMEAAVGKLERQVMKLKHQVEALHDSSEDNEPDKVDSTVPRLARFIAELDK